MYRSCFLSSRACFWALSSLVEPSSQSSTASPAFSNGFFVKASRFARDDFGLRERLDRWGCLLVGFFPAASWLSAIPRRRSWKTSIDIMSDEGWGKAMQTWCCLTHVVAGRLVDSSMVSNERSVAGFHSSQTVSRKWMRGNGYQSNITLGWNVVTRGPNGIERSKSPRTKAEIADLTTTQGAIRVCHSAVS